MESLSEIHKLILLSLFAVIFPVEAYYITIIYICETALRIHLDNEERA